jgi:hypothetical protein
MPPNPLRPLPADQFDYWKAHHLLHRAGFGGSPAEVRALASLGLEAAVDLFVDLPTPSFPLAGEPTWASDIFRPPTVEEARAEADARRRNDEAFLERLQQERTRREALDRTQLREMRSWWLGRMIAAERPLEEKMTLFWHGHYASSWRTIEDSWHLLVQQRVFRTHAVGDVRALAQAMIRDPAMLEYLDNDENRRASPNENLARELMELFVLGEGNGYTERDIKEGARALTGYTFDDDAFVFREGEHDPGEKTIFGRRGRWNGEEFVAMLFTKPVAADFLAWKLFRFFVNDAPGEPDAEGKAFVLALGRALRDAEWSLKPVLKALFTSRYFYDDRNAAAVVKSPIQLIVQAIRSYRLPVRSLEALASAADLMGQNLFDPPTVKGWDGGRAWINTSTLFVRQNLLVYLLTGRRPARYGWPENGDPFDATHLVAELRASAAADGADLEPDEIARFLLRFSLSARPHPDRVAALSAHLRATAGAPENDRLVAALALVTAMPEYQLC